VRQVGHLSELYEDAGSEKYKKFCPKYNHNQNFLATSLLSSSKVAESVLSSFASPKAR
jgi:hypothetical protein